MGTMQHQKNSDISLDNFFVNEPIIVISYNTAYSMYYVDLLLTH